MIDSTSPVSTVLSSQKTFPIEKAAVTSVVSIETTEKLTKEIAKNILENSDWLWQLQQLVFDAKIKMQSFLLEKGHSKVNDPVITLRLDVNMMQHTVDSEATDGKDIVWPEENHYITVAQYSAPVPWARS